MITVDKFLCFTLETGGLVIGWLSLISSILLALISIIVIIFTAVTDCEKIAELYGADPEGCSTIRGIFIGLSVFLVVVSAGIAYISYLCIQGTKARNHFRVKPMMIILAIAAVLSLLNIFALTAQTIVSGLLSAVIDVYFFIVIYSLYTVFRQEHERGSNKQYQPTA